MALCEILKKLESIELQVTYHIVAWPLDLPKIFNQ